MKLIKLTPQKNTAQAMVEFAIVLPILLLLLYGLLEAGRLLFMYSTVVTASRQAARYGATTGGGGDFSGIGGPNNSSVSRFQDCYGIRNAANRVDYLNAFNHTGIDISITYDNGIDSSGNPIAVTGWDGRCDGSTDPGVTPSGNNSRIVVTITGHFNPIVRLVPFPKRELVTTSSRTILTNVTIAASGGTGPDTTEVVLELDPHRDATTVPPGPPHSRVGEAVTANVRVNNLTSTAIPTGTINYTIRNKVTSIVVTTCTSPLVNGIATPPCFIIFNDVGIFNVHAEYVPTDSNKFKGDSDDLEHEVGQATPTIIITDTPPISGVGDPVGIRVQVIGAPGIIPTGTVTITTAAGDCTRTLSGGEASCTVTYTSVGTTAISAAYSGDSRYTSNTGTDSHTVEATTPTSVPTTPPTSVPPTVGPTAAPTPVSNCNTIRDAVGTINFSTTTMSLNIPNSNGYPVTVGNIYVAWNYDKGHIGSNSNLKLLSVKINSTIIWQSATGIHQPNYTITSFSNPAVFPANQLSQLTFTFDQTYNSQFGEQIQIQFSTPGCEPYPVVVPVGAATPVLKVQLISGGTDNNQQSQFRYRIQNIGSSTASNITVRIYFETDSPNKETDYVLEKYWDESGVATVSGPTQVTNKVSYFTINYGSASLAAGSTWEFQTSLHLSSWNSNYSGTNDWWHGTGALPSGWTDWTRIPVYVNGSIVTGSAP